MPVTVGFDIYGTLVNPLEMNRHLRPLVGDLADRLSELWREKQVEYAFRRGLMGRYEDFGVCSRQAFKYCQRREGFEEAISPAPTGPGSEQSRCRLC